MVMEHQTRMTNLLTRLGWEMRMEADAAKLDEMVREIVEYMLFEKETPLTEPIKGSERYAADFAALGPKDHKGRSLRDLDMKTRMFKYPCSFRFTPSSSTPFRNPRRTSSTIACANG